MTKDVAMESTSSKAKGSAKGSVESAGQVAAKGAFRPMRRRRQEMGLGQTMEMLCAGEYGVLALASPDDVFPYAVPISYAVLDARACAGQATALHDEGQASGPKTEMDAPDAPICTLVMHCALEGHKLDLIEQSARACFTVVGHSEVAPEKLTAIYASVMAFGTVRVVEDSCERAAAFAALGAKYCPGLDEFVAEEVAAFDARTTVLALDVAHLSGKQAKELV